MTDLEITKLCAEAMGLRVFSNSPVRAPKPRYPDAAIRAAEGKKAVHWYDPLHNDAQAMVLVKRHRLTVLAAPLAGWIVDGGIDSVFTQTKSTDLNRAICECVAKMESNKKFGQPHSGHTE